ncbi:DUF805 domain-containing protein [Novosphingobium sp. YJ-S2-02]|uniref:DUF805 domain-containing protein n=1 Tax=Novosphingobium aureum TaxID=2792964 RepID=A0A931ML66_9SPHN|nr:DUF805 domain-containing protein [Novosphingobium aureum]MBH0113169.1 DUF805 domain-containing protein [Novosphingobium aureum]
MLQAIKYNLANLTRFSGRDRRQTFWLYVLVLVILQAIVSFAVSVPLMGAMMGEAFEAAREGASEAQMQSRILAKASGSVEISTWVSAISSLLLIGLLAASFTRRLHDSSKPGWIAAIAALLQLASIAIAIANIDQATQIVLAAQTGDLETLQEMQRQVALQGMIGWLPLLIVLVFGLFPSTPGDNRYGEEPAPGL